MAMQVEVLNKTFFISFIKMKDFSRLFQTSLKKTFFKKWRLSINPVLHKYLMCNYKTIIPPWTFKINLFAFNKFPKNIFHIVIPWPELNGSTAEADWVWRLGFLCQLWYGFSGVAAVFVLLTTMSIKEKKILTNSYHFEWI